MVRSQGGKRVAKGNKDKLRLFVSKSPACCRQEDFAGRAGKRTGWLLSPENTPLYRVVFLTVPP